MAYTYVFSYLGWGVYIQRVFICWPALLKLGEVLYSSSFCSFWRTGDLDEGLRTAPESWFGVELFFGDTKIVHRWS